MTSQERATVYHHLETILLTHVTEQHGGQKHLTYACIQCQAIWRVLSVYEPLRPTPNDMLTRH